HGQGIGAALLRNLIAVAQTLGIETLVGYVLADNRQMLRLGRKTGFHQQTNREMGGIELTIEIPSADSLTTEAGSPSATITGESNHRSKNAEHVKESGHDV
ncbi:MAG: GNAT family N-acetyltransferase, partial [Desulfosarcina sp.]|nr:GNAT family N-acetyltransferase [Desulfobacterales bacterium]